LIAPSSSPTHDLTLANLLLRLQVVVCTCNGAGDARLQDLTFRIVALDEASQATEPAALVPLVKGAECVVMAGDTRQLPPTVLSERARR
jgi:regulator of nonsense transcripts 1